LSVKTAVKKYSAETLAGWAFQQTIENKNENYLVVSETRLSLRPALQKSTLHKSSLHRNRLPTAHKISIERERKSRIKR
jgi:hypothetical protein